ncbi:MAG: hypothetical protein RLZZ77_737 [Bacteroidota bacterium]|jgi:hypothetical protein
MKKELSAAQTQSLLSVLQQRFEKNKKRHAQIEWSSVVTRLEKSTSKLWSLEEMEQTGGEPDVVGVDAKSGEILFMDCSVESPSGRRSFCYDKEGWESRKEHRPESNAVDAASEMGVELLNEEQYRYLQSLGTFDTKTSSWLKTPDSVRKLGGSLFGDFRYGQVFIYHNGAQSYYAARGFRGLLRV